MVYLRYDSGLICKEHAEAAPDLNHSLMTTVDECRKRKFVTAERMQSKELQLKQSFKRRFPSIWVLVAVSSSSSRANLLFFVLDHRVLVPWMPSFHPCHRQLLSW
mmetsp:Transcript_20400/g.58285  ORF Transcript_20400/g.58285 Transcript_20400/m.58285 type:complete len:105 (+) Transcript_20400:274-588(+)